MPLDPSRHPCFHREARHEFARVHLPVAPKCNIQCNFCDRKFDCANESRPGVTSTLLNPGQAMQYLDAVRERVEKLSVVGIAGPGDPFANADETMETLRLARRLDPELLLCVASNGLAIAPYVEELAELQVTHVTITVNAVRPEIGARIYAWVRDGKRLYRGIEGAALLWERQQEAIRLLAAKGVTVKVNTIVMPGVNDEHVEEIAETVKALGANVLNCMPLHPVAGTPMAACGEPSHEAMVRVREAAGKHLPQMKHCARCRADAVGKLGESVNDELVACLQAAAQWRPDAATRRNVAVATREGMLVNQHLGEADALWIYVPEGDGFTLREQRPTPPPGGGDDRWRELAERLADCRAILVQGVGGSPQRVLKERGVEVVLTEGLIDDALEALAVGARVPPPRKIYKCGEACSGKGQGCM